MQQRRETKGNKIEAGKSFLFWGLHDEFRSVAVVGLGKKVKEKNDIELISEEKEAVRIAASAGCRALHAAGIKQIAVESLDDPEAAAEGSILGSWKFQEYKTKKEDPPLVTFHSGDDPTDQSAWDRGAQKATAQNIARKLSDTPGNLLTPTIFTEEVTKILDLPNVKIEVHDKTWAEKERMGAFLCVAKGSEEPPKFLEISYVNSSEADPVVLVGKGVTFDAGGISLKPAASMDQMRADMSGAANVVATLYGLAKLNVPANIRVLVPLTENLPSGAAVKPGDVIRAKNGKTICVDNTDAEGRLILADALCYSAKFKPRWLLDIATLTGAMSVAVGNGATGVFSNSDELYESLQRAGGLTGDRVWRFPLWRHYTKQVAENDAFDLNNIGKGKGGGSCTAAAFLREFVPEGTKWLHLDMAGVMGPDGGVPYLSKGMTGRPTRTLIEFIRLQSK